MGKQTVLKIFKILCVIVVAILFGTTGINAQERQTIRVGYFRYDNFNDATAGGEKSGYGYDILQKLRIYENWNYEYVGYDENTSWQDMLKLLENGKIDLLAPVNYTETRHEKFDYASLPMGTSSTVISVHANNKKYSTTDYSNWNNVSVGMIVSNNQNSSFHNYAAKHGFTYKSVLCENTDELFAKLQSGEVDMVVTSSLLKLTDVWILDEFDPLDVYYVVRKGNTALLNQVNDGLNKLAKEEPQYQDTLYQKYYKNSTGRWVQFTREEQAYIDAANKKGQVYYAVINPNRKPLSYYEDGKMKGLLVDIAREIFSRTRLNIQVLVLDSRVKYYYKIQNKSVDIICDYTGNANKAERNKLVLLDSYYNSTVSRLIRRDYDGIGKRCAVAGNSISGWLEGQGYDFVYEKSVEDCGKAVKNGKADFMFSYTKCIQNMVYDDVTNSLMAVSESDQSTNFGLAVAASQDRILCSILQKSIASITAKDISGMSEAYTYYDNNNTSMQSIIYRNPVAFGVLIFLFAALVFGIVILFLVLRRKSAEIKNARMLKQALHTSEIATQEKNDFYARMSHDMRTPMNGILGISALSVGETSPQVLQENMKKIHDSGTYLLGLINDTLNLQRIESGKLTLVPTVVSLKDFITGSTEIIREMAKEKGVEFRISTNNEDLQGYVRMDSMRMKQIVMNLLSNAIKFTPAGGTVELAFTVLGRAGKIVHDRITVTDTGIGMSGDFIEHKIFKPFSQEHNAWTDSYAGSGLGLSIVKRLVDMMGATIAVESELGVGTKVTINIDFECVDEKDVVQVAVKQKESKEAVMEKLHGKQVLIAEDQPLNAEIATRLLEKAGCEVVWVKNGLECIKAFTQSAPGHFNIILMDIRMPVMDGLAATQAIRASSHPDAKSIPIVAMTANAYESDVKKSLDAGMNAHLAKPINPQTMYETIAKAIMQG